MSQRYSKIRKELKDFAIKQKIFFVVTADRGGRINLSPKGMDTLRVIEPNKIVWLNLTGSGNETAAHLIRNNRMTILFCSFEGKPLNLRLYGSAKIFHGQNETYNKYLTLFPKIVGSRQIIEMKVDLVQMSCGFAVPLMDYKEERTLLKSWAKKQGEDRIKKYWKENNTTSIDNFETGILEN